MPTVEAFRRAIRLAPTIRVQAGGRVLLPGGVQGTLLTGGTSAEKRRVQQDFLFAQAMGATGRSLFPRIDPVTGENLSRDDRFLRPEQLAALARMGGHGPMSAPADSRVAEGFALGEGAGSSLVAGEPPSAGAAPSIPSTTAMKVAFVVIGLVVIAALAGGVRRVS